MSMISIMSRIKSPLPPGWRRSRLQEMQASTQCGSHPECPPKSCSTPLVEMSRGWGGAGKGPQGGRFAVPQSGAGKGLRSGALIRDNAFDSSSCSVARWPTVGILPPAPRAAPCDLAGHRNHGALAFQVERVLEGRCVVAHDAGDAGANRLDSSDHGHPQGQ